MARLQRNYTIVSELLKCGYRSLDAKNQLGQTAVHLAAMDGTDEILKKLIQNKASVNCRDSAGYTPLHVSSGFRVQGSGQGSGRKMWRLCFFEFMHIFFVFIDLVCIPHIHCFSS